MKATPSPAPKKPARKKQAPAVVPFQAKTYATLHRTLRGTRK